MRLSKTKLQQVIQAVETGHMQDMTEWERETAAKDFQELAARLQQSVTADKKRDGRT